MQAFLERSARPGTGSELSLATRYESLIRLGEALREQRDPKGLFDLLARELRSVVPFDAIAQFDENANKINWSLCERCQENHSQDEVAQDNALNAWVYERQQPLVIRNVSEETRFPGVMSRLKTLGLQSVCALPLSTAHRRLGSLVIASEERDAYGDEEVRFFTLAAGQVALAMDDSINFQASQRAQERLELLLDLTNRVVSNLHLRDLLREIAANIRRVMQCDGAGVTLPDPDSGRLMLYALDFPESQEILHEGFTPPIDAEKLGPAEAVQSRRAVVLNADQLAGDPISVALGMKSACHLPLISRDRVLGALSLGSLRENAFSDSDVAFLGQIARQVAIAVENAVAYGEISDLKDKLAQEKLYLENEIRSELNFDEVVGRSEALRRVLKQVETVAPTDSTVLIYGETGTGKELIARAVHNLSARGSNAFVKLNCAAIPTGLLESELFGHEKGAFTGAIAQRIGRFELAHRGTMFLDEIGEVPLELQPKLLRVLQEREFERLGGARTLRTDARLIAATNRDLAAMVEEQKFRSDLFYRLNVFPVRVPPLRERPEDIPLLVRHFVQQFSRRANKAIETIPSQTMTSLVRYHWPGNIRELQNVIERAVIVSPGPILRVPVDGLESRISTTESSVDESKTMQSLLEETERREILNALEQTNWIVAGSNGAAARLGMKRTTLQSRMRKLGIRVSRTVA